MWRIVRHKGKWAREFGGKSFFSHKRQSLVRRDPTASYSLSSCSGYDSVGHYFWAKVAILSPWLDQPSNMKSRYTQDSKEKERNLKRAWTPDDTGTLMHWPCRSLSTDFLFSDRTWCLYCISHIWLGVLYFLFKEILYPFYTGLIASQ